MLERHGQRPDTPDTEPAPTMTSKARTATWTLRANAQANAAVRAEGEPAPTITGGHDTGDRVWVTERPASTAELQREDWPEHRPATTIAGDQRVFQPGGHHEQGQQSEAAIRVTEEEAAILQSFPPDYPWQGSRSKRFLQIGNAVPPLMARAVLEAALRPTMTPKED